MVNNINFEEGTLSFWVPKGALDYNDNQFKYLVNYNTPEGYLKIIKDKDNRIKVLYNYFNKGNCILEASAGELDNEDKHSVEVTWSLKERNIKLFIDGDERDSCEINLS